MFTPADPSRRWHTKAPRDHGTARDDGATSDPSAGQQDGARTHLSALLDDDRMRGRPPVAMGAVQLMEVVVEDLAEAAQLGLGFDLDVRDGLDRGSAFDPDRRTDADLRSRMGAQLDRGSACVKHDAVAEVDVAATMYPDAACDADRRPHRGAAT